MRQRERLENGDRFGLSLPVILAVWFVSAIIAIVSWQGIVTVNPGGATVSFGTWLCLGLGFGFLGVGGAAVLVDIVRQP